ncbi:MAG: hypothetical protein AB8H80_06405 [Planctomycetota bacterium]
MCETLPGNAAVAMPLRWTEGKLQVYVDEELLPANFVGETITGLRLRRSTLAGDVAYPGMTRTLTIRGGFQGPAAILVQGNYMANRPASAQVLFGPAVVTVPATPAPNETTTVGDQLIAITFATPLPVTAGTLYLEFESSDGPLTIDPGNWVDAVWFAGGADQGLAVPVGDGSCTTESEPTRLRWANEDGPIAGQTVDLAVSGIPGGAPAFAWVGLDAEARAVGGSWLGFGASLGILDPGMADCRLWAPLDASWSGTANVVGTFATTLDIPGAAAIGQRLAIQAAWLDLSRPVLPLSLSNGLVLVCTSAGVGNHCNSMFFPGPSLTSPWGPQIGQMPVLELQY